jgi:hypothetical protein
MRLGIVLSTAFLAALSPAQTPTVTPFIDLRVGFAAISDSDAALRPYGPDGRFSRVGLQIAFERGVRGLVTQRFGSPPAGSDQDAIEEAYLEQPGEWRIGKLFMPFGRGLSLRETGIGAEYRTQLLIDDLPIRIAYSGQRARRTEGISARIGRVWGASIAWGSHWGTQAGSLTAIRDPWLAPEGGRGHRLAIGLDGGFALGPVEASFEGLALRDGGALDPNEEVLILQGAWTGPSLPLTLSLAQEVRAGRTWTALGARTALGSAVWMEPSLRFGPDGFRDFWIVARAAF